MRELRAAAAFEKSLVWEDGKPVPDYLKKSKGKRYRPWKFGGKRENETQAGWLDVI